MGTVFKKQTTRPLPTGAQIVEKSSDRFAQWTDRRGTKREAKVTKGKNGQDRIVTTAAKYTAKYRDGSGRVVEVATGCRSKEGANSVLKDLMARAEKVKANIVTPAEDAVMDWQDVPFNEHIDDYVEHLLAKGCTKRHCGDRLSQLSLIAGDCRINRLQDIDRILFERWLTKQKASNMSAARRNVYQAALVAFLNWCVQNSRLMNNPLSGMTKANEKADPRIQRRALTEEELTRLLNAAQRRPLEDRLNRNRGLKSAELTPGTRQKAERLGRERALIYKTMVLTGLRKNELASITVGQVYLEEERSYLELAARSEKNRQGSRIALRDDLASDIQHWLDAELESLRSECERDNSPEFQKRMREGKPSMFMPCVIRSART